MDLPCKLEIDSAQCRFGARNVLNSVYLSCQTGEVVGVLGKNGVGKSVLLKMIFGALKGQFKRLTINGQIVSRGFPSGLVAYLPQQRLMPSDSKISFLVHTFTGQHRSLLTAHPVIQNHWNDKLRQLSSGQARFLETLILLHNDSPIILMDEPFTYLEPLFKLELMRKIKEMRLLKGIVVTDHSYRDILSVSDRIVLIHNGGNYTIRDEEDLITHGYIPG